MTQAGTRIPSDLAARLQAAARQASPHRRQSIACELGLCANELFAIVDDAAAQEMAEALTEIRTLLVKADEERGTA